MKIANLNINSAIKFNGGNMKNLILIVAILLTLFSGLFSQKVETLVVGPSTFNDGLAVDMFGNIYASEYYGSVVTKITPAGETSIFVNGLNSPNGLVMSYNGNLYIPNAAGNEVYEVTPQGEKSVYVNISKPGMVLILQDSTMLVGSYTTGIIHHVDKDTNITVWHSGAPLNGPIGLLQDNNGTIYVGNFTDGKVFRVTENKEFVQIGDLPGWLGFMALVGDNIYATCYNRHRIVKIPIDGSGQSYFAGSGARGKTDGDLMTAQFTTPNGIVASVTGDTLFISEYDTRALRMITGMLSITDVSEEESYQPDSYNLNQNYPNPFNPTTQISFDIPETTNITLKVFDVLGREVATLFQGEKTAGRHSVNFSAAGFSSGIYLYQLKADDFISTKKMILLK